MAKRTYICVHSNFQMCACLLNLPYPHSGKLYDKGGNRGINIEMLDSVQQTHLLRVWGFNSPVRFKPLEKDACGAVQDAPLRAGEGILQPDLVSNTTPLTTPLSSLMGNSLGNLWQKQTQQNVVTLFLKLFFFFFFFKRKESHHLTFMNNRTGLQYTDLPTFESQNS